MTRFKDFGSGDTATNVEPLSFKLHDEEFHCVPRIQGKALLTIISDSTSDNPAVSTQVILNFFKNVLEDESLTRFNALLDDKHRIVSVELLGEITGWLVEEYSNRPETQPEAS